MHCRRQLMTRGRIHITWWYYLLLIRIVNHLIIRQQIRFEILLWIIIADCLVVILHLWDLRVRGVNINIVLNALSISRFNITFMLLRGITFAFAIGKWALFLSKFLTRLHWLEIALEWLDLGACDQWLTRIRIKVVLWPLCKFPSGEAFTVWWYLHIIQALFLGHFSVSSSPSALEALGVCILINVMLVIKLRLWYAGCDFIWHLGCMIESAYASSVNVRLTVYLGIFRCIVDGWSTNWWHRM